MRRKQYIDLNNPYYPLYDPNDEYIKYEHNIITCNKYYTYFKDYEKNKIIDHKNYEKNIIKKINIINEKIKKMKMI